MTTPSLLAVEWDGEVLRPLRRFARTCDEGLVVGEIYHVEIVDEVQSARDKAYHVNMVEAWRQLPEDMAQRFPKPDDFRHWCLVECGFCTVTKLAFASADAVMGALALLRHDGAQIGVVGAVVVVKRPLSQKLGRRGDMDKETRLRSYRETSDLAASLIQVEPEQIDRNVREAA